MRTRNILGTLAILLAVTVFATSCKKNKEAKAIITVLQEEIDIISGDTIQSEVAQAQVRFYLDVIGAEHIDTLIPTNTSGKSEFVWFEDAIIQYDVQYGTFTDLENFIILEQGETVEKTVIIE